MSCLTGCINGNGSSGFVSFVVSFACCHTIAWVERQGSLDGGGDVVEKWNKNDKTTSK
jgi:hypothetical protein